MVKAKTTTPASAPAPAPVVEVKPPTPAPAKKAASKKEKAPPVVVEPPVVEVPPPVVEETPVVEGDPVVMTSLQKLSEFNAKLHNLSLTISSLRNEYKQMEKSMVRELKATQKKSMKRKKKNNENRAPSGFVKPALISTELATFLDKSDGTEMARTEVSKEINKYIKLHDLQDPKNRRKILPNPPLAKLLNVGDSDDLTYFNLQRHLKHHFVKGGAVAVAAAAEATAAAAAVV